MHGEADSASEDCLNEEMGEEQAQKGGPIDFNVI